MTYQTIKEDLIQDNGYTENDLPLTCENDDGEFVIVDKQIISEDEIAYVLKTAQHNDRLRIDIFYLDGTIEEYFE